MTKQAYPVRPVYTADDYMERAPLIHETASSRTAAVRLARQAGHRVLTVGGIVEVSIDSVDSEGNECLAWTVTIHPEPTS